ncbi:Arb2 domain-containing protein [Podospora aff. communis PSN243]|uniref:Arb2 domain-containing protein n=1 Tax=Podospora aff. communis PSN243 TaxID=3040156 RepID=A0AAV9GHU2_9PEZI|nr:Arb2 domain-containing protein [Podospora aff. communis PSN243]
MFRRRWSGLPADPIYPSNLLELGYFINNDDEVRSIEDPDCYFKYYTTKNERWNDRQSFAFNEAINNIVSSRLDDLGLDNVLLPLGTTSRTEKHVPIRITPNLAIKSRVVLIFGEPGQALGIRAYRVCDHAGGINKGSMIGFLKALLEQPSSATDRSPPGIILANPGELWWWPEGKKGLTVSASQRIPMASAVHAARVYKKGENTIPENANLKEHVRYMFEKVLPEFVGKEAKVDIIAIGESAEEVEMYLNDDVVWGRIGRQMNSMLVLSGFYSSENFVCDGFKKFVKERARAYIEEGSPVDTAIAGPGGNAVCPMFTSYGCPVFSAGEKCNMTETILIKAEKCVLKWLLQVTEQGEEYKNDTVEILGEAGISPEQMEKLGKEGADEDEDGDWYSRP